MRKVTLAVAGVALIAAACGNDQQAQPAEAPSPAAPQRVEVTAVDYAFEGVPETLEAGEATFVLTNAGEVSHEMTIAQLRSGISIEEAVSPETGDSTVPGTRSVIPRIEPGASGEVTLELEPGRYGYVCFLGEGTGKPHAFEGMLGEFTVE